MATKSNLTKSVEKGDRYGRDGRENARRVRVLYRALRTSHGAGRSRAETEAHCLKVSELTIAAENLRAKLLATAEPTDAMINAVTRAESTASRAGRVLDKLAPPKTENDRWAEAWERAQEGK
jgi:outer membrane murein-binding lipoprotein Lpp